MSTPRALASATACTLILAGVGGCQTPPVAPAAAAGATATPAMAADKQPSPGATSQSLVAELAYRRGDCRQASETYAAAAIHGTAPVARRASEVALECENLPSAWQSAQRWHAVAPNDRDAAIIDATVALKLYRIPEARAVLGPLLKTSGPKADTDLLALLDALTNESDALAVLAAVDESVDVRAASARVLTAFGGLALEAYDFNLAESRAKQALAHDANETMALRLMARIQVLRGDADGALATAREVMKMDGANATFELADTLTELDRLEEARQELDRLRASAGADEVDRRLALLAYQSGDMEEARRRFSDLIDRGEASDAALFYLADIAEQSGHKDEALEAYRELADSSMALAARSRAAALLLDRKDHAAAMQVLDAYTAAHPQSAFEVLIAKAHALGDHGDFDEALALLTAAQERYPHHPTLQYERAEMFERAGRVHDSVAAFEQLLAERPGDPNLQNALGYTLADHGLELSRAEGLIRGALAKTPDNPAVLDSLAWTRLRRGDARGAVGTLARAYTIGRDPEIAAHWGEALWMSGNHAEARQVWAAALARHPDSEPLKATLHRLLPAGHE